jgi:hypothetical protein
MKILTISITVMLALLIVSCSGQQPISPTNPGKDFMDVRNSRPDNRWVWGNWQMHIPADHSRVDILPVHTANQHYNVKMLLEKSPCDNCIWTENSINHGDGTVSLDISIKHPYPFNEYYTGFDVRGILYAIGHYIIKKPNEEEMFKIFPSIETGDVEVLDPDGYTESFSPFGFYGTNDPPILRYQFGGDLGGSLDKDDNEFPKYDTYFPFLNYYSSEVRRHFATNATVTRTWHIALPPGVWDFGYSVDANWAPPVNFPVKDIEKDFPKNANTLKNYRMDLSMSNPLKGLEPQTLTIRVYHHLSEVLPLYETSNIYIFSQCLEDLPAPLATPDALTFQNDQYVEFTYELRNDFQRPPGRYPILVKPFINFDDLFAPLDARWFKNSDYAQIIWVEVVQ